MSKMKEKNLRRFVAFYIAGSMAFGGVAYAEEGAWHEEFLNGQSTTINDDVHADGGVTGGSLNSSVATSDITVNSNGTVCEVTGGGIANRPNALADVGQVTIKINGGEVEDVFGGGYAYNSGTANITGKSSIEITDGTVEGVAGGGVARSGSVSVSESVITINGNSEIGFFQGGGYTKGDNSTSNVDKTTITINGGTIGGDVYNDESFGGGFATAATTAGAKNVSNVGDVTINIHNGTFKNSLYGGGNADIEDEDTGIGQGNASAHVENVKITVGGTTKADGEDVAFYAGGKTNGANASSTVKNASLTVKDTASLDEIYGGGDSTNGTMTVDKTTLLVQDKAKVNTVYGGGFSEVGVSEVKETTISIQGEATVDKVYGGGVGYSKGASSLAKVGTTKISIQDNAKITAIYGGGFSEGNAASTTVENSTIDINGGQIGEVYAGGAGENKVTNSTINISAGEISGNISGENVTGTKALNFTQGAGSTVDGKISGFQTIAVKEGATTTLTGLNMSTDESHGFTNLQVEQKGTLNISGGTFNATIQGAGETKESALNFTAGKGSTINNAISGFDTVTVATGAKATLTGENVADGTAAIEANALNIEENSTLTISKNMTFNLGSISSPIPAAFALHSARVANGKLNLSGELKIMTGAGLTLEDTTLVSHDTGMVTVDVEKNNSTLTVGTLNMVNSEFTNDAGEKKVNLNIGLPIDEIKNLSGDGLNEILKNALAPTVASGMDISDLKIGNGKNAEYRYLYDEDGNIIGTEMNNNYLGFYTGVRQANVYITQQMIENIHDRNASLRGGTKTDDFWVNIRGGSTDVENQYGKAEVKNQYYQLGYDWDVSTDDNKAMVGVYFSKIYGDITQYNIKSDIDNAYDFGIYGMKEFSDGNYLGLVGRYGQTKNSARIDNRNMDWKDKGYAFSAEFGKRMEQKSGWMLEPYMQLTYNHLSDADLNTGSTDAVLEGSSLLDGRIGVRFIQQEKANPNNTVFGGLSYVKGLSGGFKMKSKSGLSMSDTDNDANAFEVMIGVNRQISQNSTLNLSAKKEFGDYDGWSVQGMVNVAF